jgi:hypothetical protein
LISPSLYPLLSFVLSLLHPYYTNVIPLLLTNSHPLILNPYSLPLDALKVPAIKISGPEKKELKPLISPSLNSYYTLLKPTLPSNPIIIPSLHPYYPLITPLLFPYYSIITPLLPPYYYYITNPSPLNPP